MFDDFFNDGPKKKGNRKAKPRGNGGDFSLTGGNVGSGLGPGDFMSKKEMNQLKKDFNESKENVKVIAKSINHNIISPIRKKRERKKVFRGEQPNAPTAVFIIQSPKNGLRREVKSKSVMEAMRKRAGWKERGFIVSDIHFEN